MAIYRQVITLDAVSSYPGTPQVVIPFVPKSIAVVNEGPTGANAFVSFDGQSDDAQLTPGTPSAGMVFSQRTTRVWLKRGAAASGIVVQIVAEG